MYRICEKAYKTCRFRAYPFRRNPDFDRSPFDGKALKSLRFLCIGIYLPHSGVTLLRDCEKVYKTCRFEHVHSGGIRILTDPQSVEKALKSLYFRILGYINSFHEQKASNHWET